MVAWIADEVPGGTVDWSDDEDEGITGFSRKDSYGSTDILELFDSQFDTS